MDKLQRFQLSDIVIDKLCKQYNHSKQTQKKISQCFCDFSQSILSLCANETYVSYLRLFFDNYDIQYFVHLSVNKDYVAQVSQKDIELNQSYITSIDDVNKSVVLVNSYGSEQASTKIDVILYDNAMMLMSHEHDDTCQGVAYGLNHMNETYIGLISYKDFIKTLFSEEDALTLVNAMNKLINEYKGKSLKDLAH